MTIITRMDRDRVAILQWDDPDLAVNTQHRAAVSQFSSAVREAIADTDIDAIVVASGKAGFIAGGDLNELWRASSRADIEALVGPTNAIQQEIEGAGKPIIAAIHGGAFGGGFELALSCHARIAAKGAQFGLPELSLGLMPGAGGTQRLPRLLGLEAALPILVNNRTLSAEEAKAAGLVVDVVGKDDLIQAAVKLAKSLSVDQVRQTQGTSHATPEEAATLIGDAKKKAAGRAGPFDSAEELLIGAVEEGLGRSLDEGLAIEREAFIKVALSQVAKNRIRLFFAARDAKAIRSRPSEPEIRQFAKIAVVGGGLMGGGIAYTAASFGLDVALVEADAAALERGLKAITNTARRQVDRGRMTEAEMNAIMSRIDGRTNYDHVTDADGAIEAVVELENVKADVIAKLDRALPDHAIIASNTSTFSITKLAAYSQHPERVIGMHFFAPVERMPLVEIICSPATSQATLAASLDLSKALRKSPVVVNDGVGFFTSRVVGSYTGEALNLLAEGVEPARVDRVAMAFGMPIGPLAMADMTGIRLLSDIFRSLRGDGARVVNRDSRAEEALAKLIAADRFGRREKAGIYAYPANAPEGWSGLSELFPPTRPIDDDEIRDRLILTQVLESARALEEGIVATANDADFASVTGWSFPSSTGGVLGIIDTMGAGTVVERTERLAESCGGRFEAPAILRDLKKNGGLFHYLKE